MDIDDSSLTPPATSPEDTEPAVPLPEMDATGLSEVPSSLPAEEPPADAPQEAPLPQPDAISLCLEGIASSLQELRAEFNSKLRYDEGRQIVIDRQHEELERFRKEEAGKLSRALILDIISEIDSVEKNADFYQGMEPTPENFAKLLRLFNGFSEDLRDLLENNDIITYRSEPGTPFNARRQRVLKTVPTTDAELDKTVARSLRWGFETTEGRLIRHELVAVHVCKPAAEAASQAPTPAL